MGEATRQQKLFVDEYLKLRKSNATQAAINAGYSPRSAASQASQLLKNPKVMKYLDKRESAIIQEIQQEFIFDALEARKIMYELGEIGQQNLKKVEIQSYIQERLEEAESKRVADAKEVLEYLTSVMRGEQTEEVVVTENVGDFMSRARTIEKQVNARERIKAAELLGKRYALYTDKVDGNLNLGIQIVDDVPNED